MISVVAPTCPPDRRASETSVPAAELPHPPPPSKREPPRWVRNRPEIRGTRVPRIFHDRALWRSPAMAARDKPLAGTNFVEIDF